MREAGRLQAALDRLADDIPKDLRKKAEILLKKSIQSEEKHLKLRDKLNDRQKK